MLLSLRGVSAPKLNAAQLWQILNDYLSELVKGDGTWGTVDKMLSEHAHSLKIDESLEAEQMQHLEARAAPAGGGARTCVEHALHACARTCR
eukprot:610249-Prymnesium_polylepis.1